eukprot:7930643-Pyramimonas_sp.AAC.1
MGKGIDHPPVRGPPHHPNAWPLTRSLRLRGYVASEEAKNDCPVTSGVTATTPQRCLAQRHGADLRPQLGPRHRQSIITAAVARERGLRADSAALVAPVVSLAPPT